MSAKVAVIVPIYNVEKYLPKCLDSLTNQTFKDIEIWAISDGSPDNSVDIIKKYSKKDKRVKCIEKENGGYGSVLEYAIKNIKTEYFIICDPDDWLRKDAIEILYSAAKENDLDLARGAVYNVYSDTMHEEYTDGLSYKDIFKPISKKVYTDDCQKFLFTTAGPHAKLFKTKLAKDIKFPHKVSFTDILLYFLFVIRAKRIMYIDEGLAYYLCDREGNTVTDVKPRIADYYYTVVKSILDQYEKGKHKSEYFYYGVFLEWLHVEQEVAKLNNKKDFLEKRELQYEILRVLGNHKKEIIPLFKYNNLKQKIGYRLLLNKTTSRVFFKFHSNRAWRKLHVQK